MSTSQFSLCRRVRQQQAHSAHRKLHRVRADQSRDYRHWSIRAFLCRVDQLSLRSHPSLRQRGKTSRRGG